MTWSMLIKRLAVMLAFFVVLLFAPAVAVATAIIEYFPDNGWFALFCAAPFLAAYGYFLGAKL